MKKMKVISSALALSLLVGGIPAFADGSTSTPAPTSTPTTTTTVTVNQTTPVNAVDPNSVLYSIKELLTQIKLLLIFNDNEKADALINQANDKVNELEVLKSNGTDKYDEEYNKKINDILKKTEDVLKKASDKIAKEDKDTQEKDKEEIEKKQVALTEVQKHSVLVLKVNLKKVPEQGENGINNATDKQEAKLNVNTATQETSSPTVQPSTDQNSTVQQSVEIVSTAQPQVSSEPNPTVAVQTETGEENHEQKQEGKEKHDNGLHLGQLKHGREPHEHKNK